LGRVLQNSVGEADSCNGDSLVDVTN
jgi:hypothetical protein